LPELPEVEVIVRHLKSRLSGLAISSFRIVTPRILRDTDMSELLSIKGRTVNNVRRRGKYIVIETDGKARLYFHLKMTGQFLFCPPHEPWDKHTHFGLAFTGSPFELRFRDVRKFGFVSCLSEQTNSVTEALDQLGPEPLDIQRGQFIELFQGRKARMKSLLLNQSFLAGIGNIYADEILFKAKVHPAIPANILEDTHLHRVWEAMNHILHSAILQGGSSIRDFVDTDRREGSYQQQHQVYGREGLPCPECSHKISRLRIIGRSSFVCPACQKLPQLKKGKKIRQ
jgi:formamidopyrimidine-DNA glycosylase